MGIRTVNEPVSQKMGREEKQEFGEGMQKRREIASGDLGTVALNASRHIGMYSVWPEETQTQEIATPLACHPKFG